MFIVLGAHISSSNWVINMYNLVAGCAIAFSLIYILGLIFAYKCECSFNGLDI